MHKKHVQQDIFEMLCRRVPMFVRANERLHQKNIFKEMGISQGSVSRILNREFDSIHKDIIAKISDYFGITKPQARGEELLPDKFYENCAKEFEYLKDLDVIPSRISFEDTIAAINVIPDHIKLEDSSLEISQDSPKIKTAIAVLRKQLSPHNERLKQYIIDMLTELDEDDRIDT